MKSLKQRFRYYLYDSDPTPDGQRRASFAVINPLVDFILFRLQLGKDGIYVVLLNLEFYLGLRKGSGSERGVM